MAKNPEEQNENSGKKSGEPEEIHNEAQIDKTHFQEHIEMKHRKKIESDLLTLNEDIFGQYWDQEKKHYVKRFTWRNKNKIEVQVINYGARITSIKMPDRRGNITDIVLGFDDLSGYIFHKDFGATVDRSDDSVRNNVFHLDRAKHCLTNHLPKQHHLNETMTGLNGVVWNSYIDDKTVIMSHMNNKEYPGELLTRIYFNLSEKNEFSVHMEAMCTKPTIVSLSNLTYFNLAGHHAGPDEIYKHVLTMNCDCFTPQKDNRPTGEIMNVVHTDFDFQKPKKLGEVIENISKHGFNQNLCINRGKDQEECFVGRALHPPSGRMLEIYSNQFGVNINIFDEACDRKLSIEEIGSQEQLQENATIMKFFNKIHEIIFENIERNNTRAYQQLRDILEEIRKMEKSGKSFFYPNNDSTHSELNVKTSDFLCTPFQIQYLKNMRDMLKKADSQHCEWLKSTIEKILKFAINRAVSDQSDNFKETQEMNSAETQKTEPQGNSKIYKNENDVIGKDRKVYKTLGGISLQTQNYPGCSSFWKFPNCILNPGDNYRHTITYKFWIISGNHKKRRKNG